MTGLAQTSDGGTWILVLAIAIGLVALAAWVTHLIWLFRSFGLSSPLLMDKEFLAKNSLRYVLGVMGLMIPIVGVIHGVATWAGVGAQVRN